MSARVVASIAAFAGKSRVPKTRADNTTERNVMAFKPNYNLQRADRNRAAQARREEKQRKREEKSAQRKAERAGEIENPPDDKKE
jgi:hypothetical protein